MSQAASVPIAQKCSAVWTLTTFTAGALFSRSRSSAGSSTSKALKPPKCRSSFGTAPGEPRSSRERSSRRRPSESSGYSFENATLGDPVLPEEFSTISEQRTAIPQPGQKGRRRSGSQLEESLQILTGGEDAV